VGHSDVSRKSLISHILRTFKHVCHLREVA